MTHFLPGLKTSTVRKFQFHRKHEDVAYITQSWLIACLIHRVPFVPGNGKSRVTTGRQRREKCPSTVPVAYISRTRGFSLSPAVTRRRVCQADPGLSFVRTPVQPCLLGFTIGILIIKVSGEIPRDLNPLPLTSPEVVGGKERLTCKSHIRLGIGDAAQEGTCLAFELCLYRRV
ncbi:unnamed protein product [Nezara viridula]|uniref:Uncharacterized protein n=1 Tax=Nezara viridula TaxID=85310 RepID=A0A9P0MWZ1_NEZVI|nr:unnamed protein product [Nezara viridula]